MEAREPLSPTRSLIEGGVVDGAVLVLQDVSSLANLPQDTGRFIPRSVAVGPGTGGMGVTWNKEGLLS